jgi:hypothetical protein
MPRYDLAARVPWYGRRCMILGDSASAWITASPKPLVTMTRRGPRAVVGGIYGAPCTGPVANETPEVSARRGGQHAAPCEGASRLDP